MAEFEALAREYKFLASADNNTYTEIGGVAEWKWTEDTKETDVSDFDDGGYDASLPTTRKCKLTLSGNFLIDPTTGARDDGQALVESYTKLFGFAGLLYIKVETRDQVAGTPPVPFGTIISRGWAKKADIGGKREDKMPWGIEFNVFGAPTYTGCFADE